MANQGPVTQSGNSWTLRNFWRHKTQMLSALQFVCTVTLQLRRKLQNDISTLEERISYLVFVINAFNGMLFSFAMT